LWGRGFELFLTHQYSRDGANNDEGDLCFSKHWVNKNSSD
jgi:hypothetical protein